MTLKYISNRASEVLYRDVKTWMKDNHLSSTPSTRPPRIRDIYLSKRQTTVCMMFAKHNSEDFEVY